MATRQEITIDINSKTGDMKAEVSCGPGGAICESMLDEILGTLPKAGGGKLPEYYQKRVVVGTQTAKR